MAKSLKIAMEEAEALIEAEKAAATDPAAAPEGTPEGGAEDGAVPPAGDAAVPPADDAAVAAVGDAPAEGGDVALLEVPEGEDAFVMGSLEFETELEEFADYAEDHDVAADAAVALEAIYQSVLDSHDRGGLTLVSAGIAVEAITNIRRRVGFKQYQMKTSAFESFDKSVNRRYNTDLALESIDATLGKIWAGIVAGIKKVRAHFKTLLNSFRLAFSNYKGAIGSFYKRLNQVTVGETDKLFNNKKVVGQLTLGGQFNPFGSIESVGKLAGKAAVGGQTFSELTRCLKTLENVEALVRKGKKPDLPVIEVAHLLPFKLKEDPKSSDDLLSKYVSEDVLPNGAVFTIEAPKKGTDHFDLKKAYAESSVVSELAARPENAEEKYLTKEALKSLIADMEKTVNAADKLLNGWSAEADKFLAAFEQAEASGNRFIRTVVGGTLGAIGGGAAGAATGALYGAGINAAAGAPGIAGGAIAGAIGGGYAGVIHGAVGGARQANTMGNREYFGALAAIMSAANNIVAQSMVEVYTLIDNTIDGTGVYINQNLKALGA